MGSSSCNKICGGKNEIVLNTKSCGDNEENTNRNELIKNASINQKFYTNFTKKFESNLPKLGKYFDLNLFNQIVPENAKNYMIENTLNAPENIIINKNVYEMKPIQFENGNIYCGSWNEKYKMDGLGQYYIQDGNLFVDGIWDDGKLIYGRIFYNNDNIYEGEIKDSNYHGKGKLIFNNGERYEGDFINGEITGYGNFTFSDGTTYEGEINKGEFKGHGVMKWINGIKFEGVFYGPILSDYGTLTGQGEKYEGEFYNNYFNGKGKYIYNNGSSYEGDFEYGLKNGKGIYKNKNDDYIYEGDWANNKPHGFGKFYNKDYIIKGVWRNGISVEIYDFEKGDPNNFDKNILNFKIEDFELLPNKLPNLEKIDNYSEKFKAETTPSYLNSFMD